VDGLLADLGASYYQMTEPARGFGFSTDGPLDCRMDRSEGETAAELLNRLSETELANLIFRLGAEGRSRKLARAIVRARPIHGTRELARVIESVSPWSKRGRLHPATKTFMALRIAVNEELEELDALLEALPRLVSGGGRAVIISFHSDEDRRVKNAFRELARQGREELLTKKVVRPQEEEIRRNPPSRSAKLRAIEISTPVPRGNDGINGNTD
jgi:16S rRNA (cytosine1402-N4)-methyltransferase